jgi:hypothetical protein
VSRRERRAARVGSTAAQGARGQRRRDHAVLGPRPGGHLRGLSKRSAWYDKDKSPFNRWWDHDHGENRYRMPEEYGPPVLAALAELHGHEAGDD